MRWEDAYVFGEEVFEDYNLFCILINSIDVLVQTTNSDSIINKFALWIASDGEFPDIKNKALADKLQSKYDKVYCSRYIYDIQNCLDEFKDCFDTVDKPKYWSIDNIGTTQSSDVGVDKSDNMLKRLRTIGEGLANAKLFYN